MVHLGFEVDLTYILDSLPQDALDEDHGNGMDIDNAQGQKGKTRVTTLFSATMPPAVERLSRKYLRKPAVITIGEAGRAVDTVEQRVEFVLGDEKKKCVLIIVFSLVNRSSTYLFIHSGNDCSRYSILEGLPLPSSFSSIKRKPRIWWQGIYLVQGFVVSLMFS